MILADCLVLIATLTPALGAQVEQQADAVAVEAYRAGDHELALDRWEELLRTTPLVPKERGRLLYNAGNAAGREGSWLVAVGYYTEALQESPRDQDLWANLEFARREAGLDPADRGDLVATLGRIVSAWTIEEARWIALWGLLLLVATLAHEAVRGGRGARTAAWVGLVLALLSTAPLARHRLADDSMRVFVVAEKGLAVRSEPSSDAQVLELAEAGTYWSERDRLSGWVGLETTSGAKGWVREQGVLVLPSPLLESGAE